MPIASTKAPTEPLSAASVVLHALAGAVHTLQPPSLCISSHHVAAPPPPPLPLGPACPGSRAVLARRVFPETQKESGSVGATEALRAAAGLRQLKGEKLSM